MMRNLSICLIALLSFSSIRAQQISYSVEKIWDNGMHNAFTSIEKFKGEYYVTFREGETHIFDKNGGSLGTTGSVSYQFDSKGVIVIEREPDMDEDDILMKAMDAGAEDMKTEEDAFVIYTAPNDFSAVREALENEGLSFISADKQMVPQNTIKVDDPETVAKIQKLLDMLDDNDDVSEVYHNAELPEEEEEE